MTVYFYHGISRTSGRTNGRTTSRPLRKISRREIFTKGREIFTRGRETFTSGRYFFTSGREIFTSGLYVFGFGRETLAEGVGATAGAGVGAGIGATTRRCNCLIISRRCAGCHLRSPFRLKRAHAHERRASSCGQTAGHCIKEAKGVKGRQPSGRFIRRWLSAT